VGIGVAPNHNPNHNHNPNPNPNIFCDKYLTNIENLFNYISYHLNILNIDEHIIDSIRSYL